MFPACRRLLFPLLHPFPRATKEIGDVCTQAIQDDAITYTNNARSMYI